MYEQEQAKFRIQESGVARIALWEETPQLLHDRGVTFYDFGKAVRALSSAREKSLVEGTYQGGFFVLTQR